MQLTTDRLSMVPTQSHHAAPLFAYRSDAVTNRFQGWIPTTLAEAQKWVDALAQVEFNTPDTWFQFMIQEKESGILVGDLGVHFLEEGNPQVELGCTISLAHQGKGYATEALGGVIQHLFQEAHKHRIFASVDPRNLGSVRMLEKLGMRQEAHHKQSLRFRGEWVDDVIYAILRAEWP